MTYRPSRIRHFWTTTLVTGSLLVGGVNAYATDSDSQIELPTESSELWIDIQNSELNASAIDIAITLDAKHLPLSLERTSFGFGQRIPVKEGTLAISGKITNPKPTVVNFVVADANGNVLKLQSMKSTKENNGTLTPTDPADTIVPLPKIPAPNPSRPTADSTPSEADPAAAAPKSPGSKSLAITGSNLITTAAIAGLTALGGAGLFAIKRKREIQ